MKISFLLQPVCLALLALTAFSRISALSSQSLPTPRSTGETRSPLPEFLRKGTSKARDAIQNRTSKPRISSKRKKTCKYTADRDAAFDYTTISTALPANLAAVPAIQSLEQCFDSDAYHCEHGWIDSVDKDGAKLHYRRFLPSTTSSSSSEPKGIIVWLHGIKGFGGGAIVLEDNNKNGPKVVTNMALVADKFVAQKGYAVYALDLYGHGYSEGTRHFVKDWQQQLQDCTNFVHHVVSLHAPDVPLFAAGESYGGCLTLHLANTPSLQDKLDSILLLAPAVISAKLPPQPAKFFLRQVLARAAPRWQPFFMPHPTHPAKVYRDERVRQIKVDRATMPYVGGSGTPFRLGTAVQLLQAMDEAYTKVIPNLTLPYCVIHGAQDLAVPTTGTDYLWETAPSPEKVMRKQPDAYHNLLADPAREDVADFLLDWTEQRIAKRKA